MAISKVGWSQLRVGIMAAGALILLFVLVFYMTSDKGFFSGGSKIYTYMDTAPGIAKGAPVRLNGLTVGNVAAVAFSGEQKPERFIRIEMEIQGDFREMIPSDSKVSVGSENLLSGRLIDITKGTSPQAVAANGELASDTTTEIEDLLRQGKTTLGAAEITIKRLEAIVEQVELGKGSIGRILKDEELYNRINSIAGEIEKMTLAINQGGGTMGKLIYDEALYADLRKTLARVDSIAASIEAGQGTAGKLIKDPALYDETRSTMAGLRKAIDDLNAGKGTAGKLLKDDQLHAEVREAVRNINTLVDNLNTGKGTAGQLLVNQQLYENLNGTAVELQGLLKDFRANPKKFLRIKLGLF